MEIRIKKTEDALWMNLVDLSISNNQDTAIVTGEPIHIYVDEDRVCTLDAKGELTWNTSVVKKDSNYKLIMENY